jgi:molecular chaperone GrpE (heat shock protein)
MSFNKYKVSNLRNFLANLTDYHDIENFDRMNKQQLVNEIKERFKIEGSSLYVVGGSRYSGFVKALVSNDLKTDRNKQFTAENKRPKATQKFDITKVADPSDWLKNHYGREGIQETVAVQPKSKRFKKTNDPPTASAPFLNRNLKKKPKKKKQEEPEYEEPTFDFHHDVHDTVIDKPLFKEDELLDFNVGKEKPKKKKTKSKVHIPTEVEEERIELAKQKELENKQKQLEKLEYLKSQITECRKLIHKENDTYYKVLQEVRQNKERRKKKDKEEYEQKVIAKHRSNLKEIKDKFSNLSQYVKQHKLDETNLNDIYKHVRQAITKLAK